MQTCLMCWSVGALPWDRKGKRVQLIHTSIKRPVFNSQLPDFKEPRGLDLQEKLLRWDWISNGRAWGCMPLTGGPWMPGRPVAPCSPCTPRGPGGPLGPSIPGSPRLPSGPLKPGSPGFPTWNNTAHCKIMPKHKEWVCLLLMQTLPHSPEKPFCFTSNYTQLTKCLGFLSRWIFRNLW